MIRLNLPPEARYVQVHDGAGSASMWEAADAWGRVAGELWVTALRISMKIAWLTGEPWQGLAADRMRSEADWVIRDMRTMVGKAARAATSVVAMAEAFEAARGAMVPREEIAANRRLMRRLVMTDVLGLNGPAIAAAQFQYDAMWARNNAVIVNYRREVSEAAQQLDEW